MDIFSFRVLSILIILLLSAAWLFLYIKKKQKPASSNHRTRDFDDHIMGPLFSPEDKETQQSQQTPQEEEESQVQRELQQADEGVEQQTQTRSKTSPPRKSRVAALMGKKKKIEGSSTEQNKQKKGKGANDNAPSVISLCLRARRREGFNGRMLLSMFDRFNLVFGKMDVFHRRIQVGGKEESSFSVINGEKPGTLKPEDMEESSTHRIMFYISLYDCYSPLKSFDEMVDVAKQFAVSLDGNLYDDQGSSLSEQNIEYHRDIIKDFLHKQRVAMAEDN